eukprot:GGOE01036570.1.p2 GENE.GGOE01036570.1~~GGOE01036570.1.p2  ORF type:complete len:282 (+),score=78.54 GGOE01036570.1:73-918(+)
MASSALTASRPLTRAIVRTPGRSLVDGITTHPAKGKPSAEAAVRQHAEYIRVLQQVGLDVTVLPTSEEFPDSCFVEDAAVCTPEFAILSRPGAASRAGEVDLIRDALCHAYAGRLVYAIEAPGTLEGGDVMAVGGVYFIGLSARTNQHGADQFCALLQKHGMEGVVVPIAELTGGEVLHLKTAMTHLQHGVLLVWDSLHPLLLAAVPRFATGPFHWVPLCEADHAAANALWLNGTVLLPAGPHGAVWQALEETGLFDRIVEVDISEFDKVDGGLTCLSLRF